MVVFFILWAVVSTFGPFCPALTLYSIYCNIVANKKNICNLHHVSEKNMPVLFF